MSTIESLLNTAELPDSPTPRLDAELLLAAALGKPRSYLRTWPERELDADQLGLFRSHLQRRRQGEPVAYILGHQGFWSLDLEVAPHTLIPRPDTELLVESALALLPATPLAALDLGTAPAPLPWPWPASGRAGRSPASIASRTPWPWPSATVSVCNWTTSASCTATGSPPWPGSASG